MRTMLLLVVFFCMLGCGNKSNTMPDKPSAGELKETLIEANKNVLLTEDQQIRNLISRYGWEMEETGTGLRYLIYKKGNGPVARRGLQVKISYTVRLISGDVIYSSDQTGPKSFTIGSGGVESGLEEAILHMHQGDKAKLVIPSHLAFGLTGDNDQIPPKATLIYDIELIELK